jgi:peptidoglycan/LPS O-acetylase OafA/YrhL
MSSKAPDNYIRTVLLILVSFCGLLLGVIVYGGNLSELFGRTSKEQIRFFVMLAGALLCAALAHALLRRWFLACVASGVAFSLIIQAIAFLRAGHLDPFFPIALVVGCLLGFAAAAPVGLIFHLARSHTKRP